MHRQNANNQSTTEAVQKDERKEQPSGMVPDLGGRKVTDPQSCSTGPGWGTQKPPLRLMQREVYLGRLEVESPPKPPRILAGKDAIIL